LLSKKRSTILKNIFSSDVGDKAMCGIFGFVTKDGKRYSSEQIQKTVEVLFKLSESRGKEAAGIAVKNDSSINVLKSPLSASDFLKTPEYKKFAKDNLKNSKSFLALIGHSRLATHGSEYSSNNNQPVIKDDAVCVHNGIVANDAELWNRFPELKRESEVDTEVLLSILQLYLKNTGSLFSAVTKTFEAIEGSASLAVLFNNNYSLLLTSNTGSLYFCLDKGNDALVFGSERYIVEEFIQQSGFNFDKENIKQIAPRTGHVLDIKKLSLFSFSFSDNDISLKIEPHTKVPFDNRSKDESINLLNQKAEYYKLTEETKKAMTAVWENLYAKDLKRCKKCLLSESMSFVDFDEEGICNYCRDHKKIKYLGQNELEKIVAPFRRDDGRPDCIAMFSGGRDSSYGLYYIKQVLKLNPVAFTYDWGVLTDLGRRNEARVCGELGIEHIIISADIRKKRRYIKNNVEAWLKKPDLGMVPLFMAGDKELLKQIEWLKKRMGLKISLDSAAPAYESDLIKVGFAGVSTSHQEEYHSMPLATKAKLTKYYLWQYLKNPAYFNRSMFDAAYAFYCSFVFHLTSLHIFNYIEWEEKKIISTIVDKFKWEKEKDTAATWRIDDGTAPFYNYIYLAAGGVTENDIFRSIQIRENQIDRETAYRLIREENKPRFDSLEWYAKIIGFDINQAIGIINKMPKRYTI